MMWIMNHKLSNNVNSLIIYKAEMNSDIYTLWQLIAFYFLGEVDWIYNWIMFVN